MPQNRFRRILEAIVGDANEPSVVPKLNTPTLPALTIAEQVPLEKQAIEDLINRKIRQGSENACAHGRLHIVSVVPARINFAEKWAPLSQKVSRIMDRCLARHVIAPNNAISMSAEVRLIVYAEGSSREIDSTTLNVADDIVSNSFGEANFDDLIVCYHTERNSEGRIVLVEIDKIGMALSHFENEENIAEEGSGIGGAGDQARNFEPPPGEPVWELIGNTDTLSQSILRVEDALLSRFSDAVPAEIDVDDQDILGELETTFSNHERELGKLFPNSAQVVLDPRSNMEMEPSVWAPVMVSTGPDGEPRAGSKWRDNESSPLLAELMEIVYNYCPVWQTNRDVVTTYAITLGIKGKGTSLASGDLIPRNANSEFLASIDRVALLQCVTDLAKLIELNITCLFIIPVHQSALQGNETRM